MPTPGQDTVRVRRRPQDLQHGLIAAASTLFVEHGYQSTSQKQIAARAGVSTSVLFRNFGSKKRLFVASVIEPLTESIIECILDSTIATPDHGGDVVQDVIERLIGSLRRHRGRLRAVLTALQTPDGEVLMAEMGHRFDVLAVDLHRLVTDRLDRTAGIGRTDHHWSVIETRLLLGIVTLFVLLDDWLLPNSLDPSHPRLLNVLARTISYDAGTETSSPADGISRTSRRRADQGLDAHYHARVDNRRRSPDQVRAALIAAATWLFRQSGYSGTSYKDIADAAGTSESALFRHFGSKAELLVEAVLQPFADDFEIASKRWAAMMPTERGAAQAQVVAELYGSFVANRHLARVLLGLAMVPDRADLDRRVAERFQCTFAQLTELAQERARSDRAQPYESDLRIRVVVAMVIAAATLDDWFLRNQGSASEENIVGSMSDLISRGRSDVYRADSAG